MKWVSTRLPSIPCHQKVVSGKSFVSFQLSLVVRKYFTPQPRMIWGMAKEYPNVSGSQKLSEVYP